MAISKAELDELEEDAPAVETKSVDVDELDELLADYKQKYKETENANVETASRNLNPEPSSESMPATANPNAWIGDKRYYQRGKKMGQLKPGNEHLKPPPAEMEISGSLIDGGLFLMLIDMIFPLIITVLNNKFTDTNIKVEDLQLTEKQKRDLEPIATEVIKQMSISADPKWLLLGSLAGIYGINYMAVISNASEVKKVKRRVEKDEND